VRILVTVVGFGFHSQAFKPWIWSFLANDYAVIAVILCLHTSLFTLADTKRPSTDHSQCVPYLVPVAPGLDPLDLLDDELALQLGVFLDVSIATALVVFPTKMDPNIVRDLPGTDLVPPEDVRYRFSQLRSCSAVFDKHAPRFSIQVVEYRFGSEGKSCFLL
jgi:hypothetical protein